MNGIDSATGKSISGIDHLRQSIRDILTTPVGSRVMRRDYGSRLPYLIDAPLNRATILEIYAEVFGALGRHEPRIAVESVKISAATPGTVTLTITGKYTPDGSAITLEGVEVN